MIIKRNKIQTSIEVEFEGDTTPGIHHYLQWKEHPASWDTPSHVESAQVSTTGGKCKAVAEPLQPGTTYCVRLLLKNSAGEEGPPGEELILDTEQVGCTPKAEKGCSCTVS